MDAKTRDLALLGALSLFLTVFAWSRGHLVLDAVFLALASALPYFTVLGAFAYLFYEAMH
jgi:hypothetical protein